jgi:hypothetical protein
VFDCQGKTQRGYLKVTHRRPNPNTKFRGSLLLAVSSSTASKKRSGENV